MTTSQKFTPTETRLTTCPCCGGAGTIEAAAPVALTPVQFRIWDALRKSRDGLTAPGLAVKVYSDRHDGGPLFASRCVFAAIKSANRRLRAAGVEIASTTPRVRGGTYKVQRIGGHHE